MRQFRVVGSALLALLVVGCHRSGPPVGGTGLATPVSTHDLAPYSALTDRLREIVQLQIRTIAATRAPTAALPNSLSFADGINAAVLIGEGGDYVAFARRPDTGAVCRYHGGATGDHLTLCIDAKGNSWRLLMPDLSDAR